MRTTGISMENVGALVGILDLQFPIHVLPLHCQQPHSLAVTGKSCVIKEGIVTSVLAGGEGGVFVFSRFADWVMVNTKTKE